MNNCNTLLKLLEKYFVEIPRLQRDYVQGRKDKYSKSVRDKLLNDIKLSIEGKIEPLDLSFVYGKASEEGRFYPVDGQQRLTTLFLLHIFAFAQDESKTKVLLKFSYQARSTTRDFFERLVKHRAEIENKKPSSVIKDAAWFIDAWKYDPSVNNAITTLDDIDNIGFDVENLKQELEEEESPKVYFQFLKLANLGREDDLYIKLNGRGRALTSFENFKSSFMEYCNDESLSKEIKCNLDGKWADLIWKEHEEDFDTCYLRFFEAVFLNFDLLKDEVNKGILENWIYTFNYKKLTDEIFFAVKNTLNYLCNDNASLAYKIIFDAIKKPLTYPDRILFHVVCKFLIDENVPKEVNTETFLDWIRVFKNLVNNSRIDKQEQCKQAIKSINSLFEHKHNLLEYLACGNMKSLEGFSGKQFEEECEKSRIICKGEAFKQAILDAEKILPYFSGQIRSALYFSKLEENDDIEAFKKIVNKISAFFESTNENTKPKNGILLRRALLSIGDYRLKVSSYKTLCIDDPNESYRTPSLKRLFAEHGKIVEELLNNIDETKEIDEQLKTIIKNHDIPQNDWRYCLIEHPALFDLMSPQHLRMRGDDLLIPKLESRGYNHPIYLEVLLDIFEKEKNITLERNYARGKEGNTCLCYKNCNIKFANHNYVVDFDDGTEWKPSGKNIIDETVAFIKSL